MPKNKPANKWQSVGWRALLILVCCSHWTLVQGASQTIGIFEIEYLDSNGYGFFDNTPQAATGGNTGTTLGAQRRQALEYTLFTFAQSLQTPKPIHVQARFSAQGGSRTSAVIASAGPAWYVTNVARAPNPDTAYPTALANKISGNDYSDNTQGIADIEVFVNSDIDGPEVLGDYKFDYGLMGNPAALGIDFVSILIHEIAHGLGFLSAMNTTTGASFSCQTSCPSNLYDIFTTQLSHKNSEGVQSLSAAGVTNEDRYSAITSGTELVWSGSAGAFIAVQQGIFGLNSGLPVMYAPSTPESGSSVSHFDEEMSPNELMEPSYQGSNSLTPLTLAVLADIGWGRLFDLQSYASALTSTERTFQSPSAAIEIIVSNSGYESALQAEFDLQATNATIGQISQTTGMQCTQLVSARHRLVCTLSELLPGQILQLEVSLFPIRTDEVVSLSLQTTSEGVEINPNDNISEIEIHPNQFIPAGETQISNIDFESGFTTQQEINATVSSRASKGGSIDYILLVCLLIGIGHRRIRNKRILSCHC